MAPPLRRGDMVWSYFPFAETPDIPARTRHAAIIIGAFSATEASRMLGRPVPAYGAAVACSSSNVARLGMGDDHMANIPQGALRSEIAGLLQSLALERTPDARHCLVSSPVAPSTVDNQTIVISWTANLR
jgi:hypothetical protein